MIDRPIIFQAPMVCALIAGRKTETRRLDFPDLKAGALLWVRENWISWRWNNGVKPADFARKWGHHDPREYVGYVANNDTTRSHGPHAITMDGKLRPSIHMPRWASRLTLELTADVRSERLQKIDRAGAMAEGIVEDDGNGFDIFYLPEAWMISGVNAPKGRLPINMHNDPRLVYRDLWNNIAGNPEGWNNNPVVKVITFKVHLRNIDTIITERKAT